MKLRFAFLSYLLWAALMLPAQNPTAKNAFLDGAELLMNNRPQRAAKAFQQAIKADPGFIPAYRMYGLAEEQNGHLEEAARQYEFVLDKDSLFSRLLYYQLGQVYYRLSQPKAAERYLLTFRQLQSLPLHKFGRNGDEEKATERRVLLQLDRDLRAVRIMQDSAQFINVTEVVNLGAPVNTVRDDYFPFFANDQQSFYYTRQGELRDEDLILGRRNKQGEGWTTNRFSNFNTLQPEGMCTLVRDGERIFFTLCHEQTSQGGCDLYAGWLIDGKVEQMEPLPDYINQQSWESQPAISCDGQQLFFASIRPGGLGGSDIYQCTKQADGTWSEPKNLGDGVNTPQDEEGPFLSNDGRTLYFASTGHYSLGDQDIFMSYWDPLNARFTQAINLGPPVNGPHRELGFHLSSDGRLGYFASNRPGGKGGLDIYRFELSSKLAGREVTYLSGYVTDSLTGEPIVDQAIPLADGTVYHTNFAGRFFICAPSGENLPLSVTHPAFFPYERTFAVPVWDNRAPYRIDVRLLREEATVAEKQDAPPAPDPEGPLQSKARVVKRNLTVRFDFDDATLLPLQLSNIDKFIESVAGKPLISIEVIGYTDESGPEGYNLGLSEERAKRVADHLQAAGLATDEARIVGLGEVSGGAMRALNRKVEVKVVYREVLPVEQ